MLSLITESDILARTASAVRERRHSMGLRQVDLAERSGVAIATLRRFERTGQIGFEGLAKLLVACGFADSFLSALRPSAVSQAASIDDFLSAAPRPIRRIRLKQTA